MRQLDTPCGQKGVGGDEEGVGPLTLHTFESSTDLTAGVGVEDLYLQAHGASSRFYLSQCRLGLMSLLGGAAPRGRRHWFVRPVIVKNARNPTSFVL
jgi:hypothetical protein